MDRGGKKLRREREQEIKGKESGEGREGVKEGKIAGNQRKGKWRGEGRRPGGGGIPYGTDGDARRKF